MLMNRIDGDSQKAFDTMLDAMLDESMDAGIGEPSATAVDDGDGGGAPTAAAEPHGRHGAADSPFNGKHDGKSLEEKMNALYDEFKADTTITVSNIRDIAFRTAAIKGRWCSRLMAERVRCRRLKESLEALTEELGRMVDERNRSSSYLAARQNRDAVVNADENVKRLRNEMYESKQLQDYLTMIHQSISDLGYVVKNSLDALNLERGL